MLVCIQQMNNINTFFPQTDLINIVNKINFHKTVQFPYRERFSVFSLANLILM